VADDDPNDVLLLDRAFKKNGVTLPLQVCSDGAEAMAYLKAEGKYANREIFPFPRVLVTDLKMPKCSGFELLAWLQRHPECSLIPKIVFSSSSHPEDVTKAYQLGVNCYFQKPTTFDELVQVVGLVNSFWLTALIPPLPDNC
jgi:CheY-like chemotaxis protein